jgi:hypothetical protein
MGAQHGTTIASIAFSRKRARGSRKAGMTLFCKIFDDRMKRTLQKLLVPPMARGQIQPLKVSML